MRRVLFIFIWLACALTASAIDFGREIDAIALAETAGAWNGQPGANGELSDYQLTRVVWQQHMRDIPFEEANNPILARVCALRHCRWLVEGLARNGYVATPARVATAWNIGLDGLLRRRGRPTPYGIRAANLYYSP